MLPVAAVAGILVFCAAAGYSMARALFPEGPPWRSERLGWGFATALVILASSVSIGFLLGLRPGWFFFLFVSIVALLAAQRLRLPGEAIGNSAGSPQNPVASRVLVSVAALGVALYGLRALTEPMWSNDFLAIWGFKAKTIYGGGAIPASLFEWPSLAFSHPEYPLGLPLLYSGLAFLLGQWDDHAMALLFPFWLLATLLVLYGWLRRRGASRPLALFASALLAHFEPLYSAFLTGMAEVPLSFAFLLVGTSLSDAIDRTDRGATRRLALASLIAAATKNEGLFVVGAALVLLLALRLGRRRSFPLAAAAALFLPAALSVLLHRVALGSHRLRDFDFGYLFQPGFSARVAESLQAEAGLYLRPTWLVLFGIIVLLLAVSARAPHGERLLALAGISLAAYLALPPFCVNGPLWLVTWTLERATAALVPLVTAAIAARLACVFLPGDVRVET